MSAAETERAKRQGQIARAHHRAWPLCCTCPDCTEHRARMKEASRPTNDDYSPDGCAKAVNGWGRK